MTTNLIHVGSLFISNAIRTAESAFCEYSEDLAVKQALRS